MRTELWNLEYTVEQTRAGRALSFGLLPWQYGSGSFAEKSLLACLSHTRKFSNLRGMHEKVVMEY